jgi:hypothetical protein
MKGLGSYSRFFDPIVVYKHDFTCINIFSSFTTNFFSIDSSVAIEMHCLQIST